MNQKELNKQSIKYNSNRYEQIKVFSSKGDRLQALLDIGASMHNISKSKYILHALKAQLERDHITMDMLPPAEDQQSE